MPLGNKMGWKECTFLFRLGLSFTIKMASSVLLKIHELANAKIFHWKVWPGLAAEWPILIFKERRMRTNILLTVVGYFVVKLTSVGAKSIHLDSFQTMLLSDSHPFQSVGKGGTCELQINWPSFLTNYNHVIL